MMNRQTLEAYAQTASAQFIEQYRRRNQQNGNGKTVPDSAYADLQRDIHDRILLIGSRPGRTRRIDK